MNQDFKNNKFSLPHFTLLKVKSIKNITKLKKGSFDQEENKLYKLTRIAKLVEERDIYKYNSLYCPICLKRNAINSLLFLNFKEFILYLGYILTFIPESYENCKLFFKNQNYIINFFSSKMIEKSLFKKENPVLICKNCLINKMNSNTFIYTFSPIFGYNAEPNNYFNIEKKVLSNENILLNQNLSKSNVIDINLPYNNILLEKKEMNQLSNNSNFNNQFLLNNEYLCFFEDDNIYKFDIDYFSIFHQFEECFNSVINCLSNIIFEMRKFKISIHKDIKEFIQLINNEKNELNYNIKILLMFQDIYSNEISNMITFNITKTNINNISKLNEIIFIKEETKDIFEKYFYNINSVIEVLNLYCQNLIINY